MTGFWGILALGLFADGTYGGGTNGVDGNVTGLFCGDTGQLFAPVIGGVTNIVAVSALTYVAWKVSAFVTNGARVSTAVEEMGLDIPEMGALAYPDTTQIGSSVVLEAKTKVPVAAKGLVTPEVSPA